MSDSTPSPSRPVSLITTLFVLALFAAFFFVVRHYYQPTSTAAFVATPENLTKDLEWKASRPSRQKTLQDVRQAEADRARAYDWVDKKSAVVQLPIERAMQLTAQHYGKAQR